MDIFLQLFLEFCLDILLQLFLEFYLDIFYKVSYEGLMIDSCNDRVYLNYYIFLYCEIYKNVIRMIRLRIEDQSKLILFLNEKLKRTDYALKILEQFTGSKEQVV